MRTLIASWLMMAACAAATPVSAESAWTGSAHGDPATSSLRLSGSTPMGSRLARELVIAYGARNRLTGVREEFGASSEEMTFVMTASEAARTLNGEVRAHGSPTAFLDLLNGTTDVGMASRRINMAEAKALAAANLGDLLRPGNENVVSMDGVAVIVHRDNPVRSLSIHQLRDLLSGATSNWSSISGQDRLVVVYAPQDRSGTTDLVKQKVLTGGSSFGKGSVRFVADPDLADAVAADPAAIGLVGSAYTRNARVVPVAGECGLPPALPTAFGLKTEEYPLSRRLYFYVADKHTPMVEDFLKFALSSDAQTAIARAGFAGLDPELGPPLPPNAEPPPGSPPAAVTHSQTLRETLRGARRLSVTIRFDLAKVTLDSRAVADLDRLAVWARGAGAGKSLILVGHSSADGEFDANVMLSRQRAREVEARLRAMGIQPAANIGVGPVQPVICDAEPESGNLNRRVEVWVR